MLTRRFDRLPARYEAGAAEFYDYSVVGPDPLRDLVYDCGLSVVPMGGSALLMGGRVIANVDDVRDVLGPEAAALARFDRLAHDAVDPRDFYRGGLEAMPREPRRFSALLAEIGHHAARRHVEQLIHSDLATEPDHTTVAYGLDNYLMNDPASMGLYAIDGGNEQLVTALAERIAGIGVVVATLPKAAERDWPKPAVPVPAVVMLGTEDTFKPWDGSRDQFSAAETVAFWRRVNGCGAEPVRKELPDRDPADGCRLTVESWAGKAPVVFYTLEGHGHGWPMQRGRADMGTGPKTRDISAAEEMWAFLEDKIR